MNSSIFFDWLRRSHVYVDRTGGRRIPFLLENAACDGKVGTLPKLNNVEVILLSPNTTSPIQPMDASVIASFERRYWTRQISRALEILDSNTTAIYNVDQLTSMKWIGSIWGELPTTVIPNCWRSTGIIDEILRGTSNPAD